MALGDYILCCKCEVKLIYDGDWEQRDWWEKRFNEEVQIICPDCRKKSAWVGITKKDFDDIFYVHNNYDDIARAIEAKLKERNN